MACPTEKSTNYQKLSGKATYCEKVSKLAYWSQTFHHKLFYQLLILHSGHAFTIANIHISFDNIFHIYILDLTIYFSINLPTYRKWIPPSTRYLLNSLSVISNNIANIIITIIVITIAKFLVVHTLVIIFIFIISSLSLRPVVC